MASPPFDINQALPGDSDVVSQHPANARTFRDVVESWLLWNHNVNGRHDKVEADHKADAGFAGTSSVTTIWASSETGEGGNLKMRKGTGNIEYVGIPPGFISWDAASSAPEGWLTCDGSAVSRTGLNARLFARIGTTYGVGDGSTTFNLPDLKGRTIAGVDGSSTRLSSTYFGATPNLAATGGLESHTLTTAQLASHSHINTLTDPGHAHDIKYQNNGTAGGGNTNVEFLPGNSSQTSTTSIQSATTGISINNVAAGSGNAHNNVQPTIILNARIKL